MLRDEFDEKLVSAIAPQPTVRLPDWMDEHIWLEQAGKLVRWETSRTPYLRQPMLDLSVDSPVEQVVIMKPSQTGCSELAIGFHAYYADVSPQNMMMFQPDLEASARFKQFRIDPVIRHCARLREIFVAKKSRDAGNTKEYLVFIGGAWVILGGNSPAGVSSLPAGIITIDEWDRMAASVGVGGRAEGDLRELLLARMITFQRPKMLMISSPGERSTSRIEPAYLEGDRRRYHVPCPECGTRIVHQMARLWWPRNGDPKTARYRCQWCDKLLDERDKPEMLARGEWIAEFPEREVHSYKLVGLDSPFPGMSWGKLAEGREKAKGNPNKMRAWVNTKAGETYDSHEETKVDVSLLKLLATPIEFVDGRPIIPRGVGVITAGTDTQPDRLETTLRGWGSHEEQWHLDHVIFPGDASSKAVWNDLEEYRKTLWPTWCGMSMGLGAMCVDTAGSNTIPAYDFVRGKGAQRVWGTVGRSGQGKSLWPRRPNRNNIGKVDLYRIGIDGAKTQLYARLKASIEQIQRGDPPGGPGFIHIAAHLCEDQVGPGGTREPSEYLKQLVAEATRTTMTKSGPVVEWYLPAKKDRNEVLDCDVLAQAALAGWRALRKNLQRYVKRFNPDQELPADPVGKGPVRRSPEPEPSRTQPEMKAPTQRKRSRPRREIVE